MQSTDVWGTQDVSGYFLEEIDVELMKEELRKVVEAELRVQVTWLHSLQYLKKKTHASCDFYSKNIISNCILI